jgi:alcohol dehydrogenase class IV
VYRRVIADVGALAGSEIARALTGIADTIVGVGTGSPVGIARLVAWMADAREYAPHAALHFVVNRAPRDR